MKQLFFVLLVCSGLSGLSQKNAASLVLGILQPDTARLEGSLQEEIAVVEQDQQDKHNQAIRQMEAVMNSKEYSRENEKQMDRTRAEIKNVLPALKVRKEKEFRYYHLLTSSLAEACTAKFGLNPSIRVEEFNLSTAPIDRLKEIADARQCDYIIFFSNINGHTDNNMPVLKLTTSVYSRKEKAVIFSQPAEVCCDRNGKDILYSLLQDAAVSSLGEIVKLINVKS